MAYRRRALASVITFLVFLVCYLVVFNVFPWWSLFVFALVFLTQGIFHKVHNNYRENRRKNKVRLDKYN